MKTKQTYTRFQMACAVLMSLALLWLTMSAPFVYSHQLKVVKENRLLKLTNPAAGNDEEAANALGSNEEKVPDTGSFSEEYLHDHESDPFNAYISLYGRYLKADTYLAFHGEILVPPPNHA
jgi:hypothetical protein